MTRDEFIAVLAELCRCYGVALDGGPGGGGTPAGWRFRGDGWAVRVDDALAAAVRAAGPGREVEF